MAYCCSTPRSYQSKGPGLAEGETASNASCLEGDFPTFLSEFGGGDCRWDFNDFGFPRESSCVDAVDSVCPQGPTAVGKSDTAVELAKQLQLQGRKANRLRQ